MILLLPVRQMVTGTLADKVDRFLQGFINLADNRIEALIVDYIAGYICLNLGMDNFARLCNLIVIPSDTLTFNKFNETVHQVLPVKIPVNIGGIIKAGQRRPVFIGIIKSKPVNQSPTHNLAVIVGYSCCVTGNEYIRHDSPTAVNYISSRGNELQGIVKPYTICLI